MRKTTLTTLFLIFSEVMLSSAAHAGCVISVDSEYQRDVIQNNGGFRFPKYAQVCEKLRKADARLHVQSMNLEHARILVLAVRDMNTTIASSSDLDSITVSTFSDKSLGMLFDEMLNGGWDIDRAIASLNEERKRARAILSGRSRKD